MLRTKECPEDLQQALLDEGTPNSRLQEQALRLAADPGIAGFAPDEVVESMLDLAQAHYRRIWVSCSTEEKILLYRIAKEGFVNRRVEEILRPLQRRGLVFTDPNCRIMNESFRRFILTAERPEAMLEWEQRGGESAWARMRAPIMIGLILVAAFFFATQREAFDNSLGFFAALTAGAPALIKILGMTTRSTDPSGR